uniref:Uncharacterized protein n=1 Tax=Iridovirus LCIVAC01 TaxID=2506607 RepID=A0A481YQK1_9VIRU|nr:MAG: hypothetical protein LCIVAC01_00590 [Iridovirus LCIVAC01]
MSNLRYIDICSTFRDRTIFPNPADFEIQLSQTGPKLNGLTALNPILLAFPIHPLPGDPAVFFAGGVAGAPILDATTSTIDNFYIDDILEDVTIGEFRTITLYDGTTKTATLDTPFSGAFAVGDEFQIRQGLPVEQGTLTGSSSSTFTLPLTSSSKDGFYLGMYIHITAGPAVGNVRRITIYDGATRTGTVGPNFTADPGLNTYEILNFSFDGVNPLNYTGSDVSQKQVVCYEMELISLILPNETLFVSPGGNPAINLPYVYVEFQNISSPSGRNKDIIYSNNPHSVRALFKAPIDDVPTPIISKWIKVDGDGMVQTVKFKPNDNFRFKVTLSTGDTWKNKPDTVPPLEPDFFLQISATFGIKRL